MKNIQRTRGKNEPPYISNQSKLAAIRCGKCKMAFGIGKNYIGITTCPYCGRYVEG